MFSSLLPPLTTTATTTKLSQIPRRHLGKDQKVRILTWKIVDAQNSGGVNSEMYRDGQESQVPVGMKGIAS